MDGLPILQENPRNYGSCTLPLPPLPLLLNLVACGPQLPPESANSHWLGEHGRCKKALQSWGVPNAPFLIDSGDASKREAGGQALPSTIVFNSIGVLRWVAPIDASAEDIAAAAKEARSLR